MSNSLVLHQPPGELLPSEDTLTTMLKASARIAASGLAGKNATADSVLALALTGRELGIPFMAAVRGIHIIEGKPSPSAGMIAALITSHHGDNALRLVESTAETCTVKYRRKGWPDGEYQQFTITMKEAKEAGWNLTTYWDQKKNEKVSKPKDTWDKFPKAMLRSRAITIVGQDAFPDSVLGLYTPDELDADISEAELIELPKANLDEVEPLRHRIDPEPEDDLPTRQVDEDVVDAEWAVVDKIEKPEGWTDEEFRGPNNRKMEGEYPKEPPTKEEKLAVGRAAIDEATARERTHIATGEILTWDEALKRMQMTRDPIEVADMFSLLAAMAQEDEELEIAVNECRGTFLQLMQAAVTTGELNQVINALNIEEVKEAAIKNHALKLAYKRKMQELNEGQEQIEAKAKADKVLF